MSSLIHGNRAPRIAFYSHDTMGLGHIRRNLLLTEAISKVLPDAEILLITGVREAGSFILPKGADTVTLPTYFKTNEGSYQPRSLGKDVRRLVAIRSQVIHSALEAFEPDLVVVDNVPRGAMSELDSVLPVLAAKGTHLVLGLRDIIDDPSSVRRQWMKLDNFNTIRDYFSSVWVYGDKTFYDLTEAYAFDDVTRSKVSFVGYLDAMLRPRRLKTPSDILPGITDPYALCVVGGGQDGFRLASKFARAKFPAGMMGVLITGSMMPLHEREMLRQMSAHRGDLLIADFVPEPLELLRQANCVVSMGGYNTTTEILSFYKRALIVPRVLPRQEQWIRASRLAEMGLVSCLHPDELTLPALNAWLAEKNELVNPRETLNFNGLDVVADKVKRFFHTEFQHSSQHELENVE